MNARAKGAVAADVLHAITDELLTVHHKRPFPDTPEG
jgi:hypothetical protein